MAQINKKLQKVPTNFELIATSEMIKDLMCRVNDELITQNIGMTRWKLCQLFILLNRKF